MGSRLRNYFKPQDNFIFLSPKLNICAVLSQLGKHEGALQHAMAAVIMLQEQMLLNIGVKSPKDPMDKNTDNKDDKRSVLAIAYHNMGVEQEFLKRVNGIWYIYIYIYIV